LRAFGISAPGAAAIGQTATMNGTPAFKVLAYYQASQYKANTHAYMGAIGTSGRALSALRA
jgi:hypothetical protein